MYTIDFINTQIALVLSIIIFSKVHKYLVTVFKLLWHKKLKMFCLLLILFFYVDKTI